MRCGEIAEVPIRAGQETHFVDYICRIRAGGHGRGFDGAAEQVKDSRFRQLTVQCYEECPIRDIGKHVVSRTEHAFNGFSHF
jgi:hypothetical protein